MSLPTKNLPQLIAIIAGSGLPLTAWAVDECGTGASVTCSAPSYTTGITYNGQDAGLTLTLNNAATTVDNGGGRAIEINTTAAGTGPIVVNADAFSLISTVNNGAQGILIDNPGSGTSTINLNAGTITTQGNGGYGARIRNHLGNASISVDSVTIDTLGRAASGASSEIDPGTSDSVTASVTMTSGDIKTGDAANIGFDNTIISGLFASGIRARHNAGGETSATMSGGSIKTYGFNAQALNASQNDPGSVVTTPYNTTANFSGGTIETFGGAAHGVFARSDVGLGDVTANVTGGTITVDYASSNDTSSAVFAFNRIVHPDGAGNTIVNFSNATATTMGQLTNGIKAWNRFSGNGPGGNTTVTVGDNSTVNVTGTTSSGIIALSDQQSTTVSVAETATVTATGDGAVGLAAVGNNDTTVTVDGTVTGGNPGEVDVYYRRNASANNVTRLVSGAGNGSGILVGSGAFDATTSDFTANSNPVTININSTANVSATSGYGILAESGNVTVNHQGTVEGFIDLADGDDTWNWTAGTFPTGSFLGNDGSDTANISGGVNLADVTLLDGGDDTTSGDGMIDTLNFSGLSGQAPAMTLWELTNVINGANIEFVNDFTTETLTIDAASTSVLADGLNITGNAVNNGNINMQSASASGTATITGNLTGSGALSISINVETDTADALTVTGDTTGASIAISPDSITTGDPTGNDVLVAIVNGATAVGDFTLPNGSDEATINGLIYTLKLVGNEWFLSARKAPVSAIPSVSWWSVLALIITIPSIVAISRRKYNDSKY